MNTDKLKVEAEKFFKKLLGDRYVSCEIDTTQPLTYFLRYAWIIVSVQVEETVFKVKIPYTLPTNLTATPAAPAN